MTEHTTPRAEKDAMDETARLLLMERPSMTPLDLYRALREYHPTITSGDNAAIWGKYRGWDGRTHPTHDVETGRRL